MIENGKINITYSENINHKRLRYVVDFINNHPLKPAEINFVLNDPENNRLNITYSKNQTGKIKIPAQNVFFSNTIFQKYYINRYIFEENSIYSVESKKKKKNTFFENGNFGFDIFETIFFHISRYEEIYCNETQIDVHKRMKSGEQLLVKNKIHDTPVVDILIYFFFKALNLNVRKRKSGYSLTHDIDIIRKYKSIFYSLKSIAKAFQMGLGFRGAINIIKSIINSIKHPERDPYFTYDWLFVNDPKFVHKTVYFVAGGNRKYDLFDEMYYKELPEIIKKAKNSSYKIGFHPSYDAYNNKKLFETEFNKLNGLNEDRIIDIRTHYLRLDLQKTFDLIEQFGFKTDSTLGFTDEIGFRCGTGFEYYPYNFKEERAWKFKELPLVFMDSSLKYHLCHNKTECFRQKALQFFEMNKYHTHIMINFHNTTFDYSLKFNNELKEFYLQLISEI